MTALKSQETWTMSYRKPGLYSIGDVIKLKGDLWLVSRWQKMG